MTSIAIQPQGDYEGFLNNFRQTIEIASSRLVEITEEQSGIPRSEGKWSPREIIGHLIDSAANNHQRFVRAQFTDDLVFAGYEHEKWEDLVQLWKLYNRHMVHLVSLIPDETRTRLRGKHNLHLIASELLSENEPVTLDFFIRDYLDHMKKHLGQILGADVVARIGS
jgi:hypothetical protein